MTGTDHPPSSVAAFRGPVVCRRTVNGLTLSGPAADSAHERLILTFMGSSLPDLPVSLEAAVISARGEHRYGIASASRDWTIEAASLHVHRDVGNVFYRAVPPRLAPLKKRLFWRVVLALAGTRAGKRLLLSIRRRA